MTEQELSGKKISELREIAKSQDIASPYKYKKDELIDIILQSYALKEKESNMEKDNEDKEGINKYILFINDSQSLDDISDEQAMWLRLLVF